jgi:hypothetical protein
MGLSGVYLRTAKYTYYFAPFGLNIDIAAEAGINGIRVIDLPSFQDFASIFYHHPFASERRDDQFIDSDRAIAASG